MREPRTLLDVFEPPEDLVGHTAALVAMSAGESVLEEAMERFTGLSGMQRSQVGTISAFLMLDGRATLERRSVLRPAQVPGLLELQPRSESGRSLLHAKLALLTFSRTRTGAPVHARLVILTANYTHASVADHLELVWMVDVSLEGGADPIDRADVAAAAGFVEELVARRFHPISKGPQRLAEMLRRLGDLAPARGKPRLIHSLRTSLLQQIGERFRREITSPRNLLLCGSGFFEDATSTAGKPEILRKLEELPVWTRRVRRVVLAEPQGSGALAAWAVTDETEGWEVCVATDPADRNRRLHAKFIYAGYLRDQHVSGGWLYLGSGNLSKRGLLTHAALENGNVECGVVFAVPDRVAPEELETRLFWRPDGMLMPEPEWEAGTSEDESASEEMIDVPPILSATFDGKDEPRLELAWRDDLPQGASAEISWEGRDWQTVPRETLVVPIEGLDAPATLRVRDAGREWTVPVFDARGCAVWRPARPPSYDEALATLLDFPLRPAEALEDEETDDGVGDAPQQSLQRASATTVAEAKSYPLHAAAGLVDNIAALQQDLPRELLGDWLAHLERALRVFPRDEVRAWQAHGVDVLAHLRVEALRPTDMTPEQTLEYESILDRTAIAWREP